MLKKEFSNKIPRGLDILLNQVVYGREGKLQYRHRDAMDRLRGIKNRLVLTLRRNDNLIGSVVFVKRNVRFQKEVSNALYVRYLAVNPAYKSNVQRKKKRAAKSDRLGLLSRELKAVIEEHVNSEEYVNGKPKFYAYIEGENFGSFNMSHLLGAEPIRKLNTLYFNRLNPEIHKGFEPLQKEDQGFIKSRLEEMYAQHTFFFLDDIFTEPNYFVLKKEGQIVAGIQANPIRWDIVRIPGFSGFIFQHILPKLPITSRAFHKSEIQFMAFEAVWFAQGNEHHLLELMESVCSHFKQYLGLIWFDKDCPVGKRIEAHGKLGFMNKIKQEIDVDIVCSFNQGEAEQYELYKTHPAYVSAFDLT